MRFISKSAGYSICYQAPVLEHYATGETRVLKPEWSCWFSPIQWLPGELEFARTSFTNRGTLVEIDGVTPVDVLAPSNLQRFSTFDTVAFQSQHEHEGFDDAEREKMEAWLLRQPDCGQWYLAVPGPVALAAPWPTYDATDATRISALAAELGCAAAAAAYEKENANRRAVIDALEALLAPAAEDELLISA